MPLPGGASPSRAGGRHPLRSADRTIRSMTTCDPRCWRFSSRNVSADSTSATRPAGTEISRCPLLPLSDRRVIFISASSHTFRIYSIACIPRRKEHVLPVCYLHVYTMCGRVYSYSGGSLQPYPFFFVSRIRAYLSVLACARSRVDVHCVPHRTRHGPVSVHPYLR